MTHKPHSRKLPTIFQEEADFIDMTFMQQNLRLHLIIFLALIAAHIAPQLNAQTLVDEAIREFEELRMRQLQTVQGTGNIGPFTTDGCSGNLSSGWKLLADTLPGFAGEFGDTPPWEDCCIAHDKVYWQGISVNGYQLREQADRTLKQCVIDIGTHLNPELTNRYSITDEQVKEAFSTIASLMYRAVRLGGQPCSLLPWRWGYGWDKCAFSAISKIPDGHSDIKPDEQVVFFNTAGWLDAEKKHWNIPIHGWIYEPADSTIRKGIFATLLESRYELSLTDDNEQNFRRRTNLMIADNERGKELVIRIAGRDVVLPVSKENGHINTTLKIPLTLVNATANQGRIAYFAVMQPGDNRQFEGRVQLVPRQGISIISDIDDTVKETHVSDHKQLFANTFYNDFRAIPGMAELYQHLALQGAKFHFVSSSPWQLYDPLQEFLRNSHFPWATMNLKMVRFRDETLFNLFKKGTETKPGQIIPILQRYPEHRFLLIGDNGEQDPEVYAEISRRYSSQISHILIRNIDNSQADDVRYKKAFKGIAREKWQLFERTGQVKVDKLW